MAPRAAFYDPDQVLCYFNGILMQGFAEDEAIAVEQMSPGFEDVVGVDGEVARSKTNDRRIKVTVKLLQTSLTNLAMSAIHETDLNAPAGAGVGAFSMQDLSGATIVEGPQAWIVSYPPNSMARTAKAREWEIHVAVGSRREGGN